MAVLNELSFLVEKQFFLNVIHVVIYLYLFYLIARKIPDLIRLMWLATYYRNYFTLSTNSIWTDLFTIFPNFPFCYPTTENNVKVIFEKYSKIDPAQKPAVLWIGPIAMPMFDDWKSVDIVAKTKSEDKGRSYVFIEPALKNGLIGSNGVRWRTLKKVYLAVLKKSNVNDYFTTMARELEAISQELKDHCIDDELVVTDLRKLAMTISYDINGPIILGRKLNFFHNKDDPYRNAFLSRYLRVFQRVFNISLWIDYVYYNWSTPGSDYRAREKKMKAYMFKIVDELYEEWKTHGNGDRISEPGYTSVLNNFFHHYFDKTIGDETWKFDFEELRLEAMHTITAGIETIANSSMWTLYALGRHPEYQEEILREIQGLDSNLASPLNFEVLKNATFLEQCIKESLRLFTTVPLIARTLNQDIEVNGKKIYKGSEAIINIYGLHHDPEVFENPYKFCPERFGPDAKRIPATAFIPFGFGSRDCVGRYMSIVATKLIVASILKDFKVTSKVPYNELRFEFMTTYECIDSVEVKLEKRPTIPK